MKYTKYNRSKYSASIIAGFEKIKSVMASGNWVIGVDWDVANGKIIPLSMRAGLYAERNGLKVRWQ